MLLFWYFFLWPRKTFQHKTAKYNTYTNQQAILVTVIQALYAISSSVSAVLGPETSTVLCENRVTLNLIF